MKAKEYAKMITSHDDVESAFKEVGKVGRLFLNEFDDVRKKRNIKTDNGLLPLLKEFDNKFRNFAVIVNQKFTGMIKVDGFIQLLGLISEEVKQFYIQNK